MDKKTTIKIAAAVSMLFAAIGITLLSNGSDSGRKDTEYFYDESEQQIFEAEKGAIAPIKGINDDELDGVRAIVIRDAGAENIPANQRVAYLQKHTPELKAAITDGRRVSKERNTPRQSHSREWVKSNTLVKRLAESKWHASSSKEGEKILSDWHIRNADGKYPEICVPSD